jgi:predicted RNA-binding Zn-ribbon protein involved in translation (DUF1610 family)
MEQIVKIKCPHCGRIRSLDIQAYEDVGETDVVRGFIDETKKAIDGIRQLLTTSSVEAANAWLDMPACPNCGKTYRYNVRTHEVKL